MNDHPGESLLLQFFDGTLPEAEDRSVGAHVAGCATCREQLDGLTAFESFVVRHMPGDALADADMFEVAERAIAARHGHTLRRRWWGVFGATAVALVAAGVALMLWFGGAEQNTFRLVRHRLEDPVRHGTTVRFHLELNLADRVFVGAWVRFGNGEVTVLLPQEGPEVAVQGAVRLPGNALLDWEFGPPRVPREVLVVAAATPLATDTLRAIGEQWRAGPADVVPALASAAGTAQVLVMPKNPN